MNAQQLQSVGTELLEYRIEAQIGQGGMGVVYRAYDLRLKRRVALKLMAPELALDERFRDRFTRETELAMALEHPNVVPVHDAGEVDGRLYIAMRHVEGTDLRALLRAPGALAPKRAIAICRQVAGALDAAHARGLVHRDVKPSNVLLDERGHVYLADFGLTRQLADPSVELPGTHSLGTPAYLAPEQIEGGPVDHRADIYSLGCFLFECLTGEAPFAGDSRLAVIWAHLEEEPPRASRRRPELPEALDEVVRRALAKHPADRYPTCPELVSAAEEALGLAAVRAPGKRLPLVVVAAALAAAVTLAAAFALSTGTEPAASGAIVAADTIVRLDPATNTVRSVLDMGAAPLVTAVGGGSIWAYLENDTVAEIDPVANKVRHRTPVPVVPLELGPLRGPPLAADAGGAWLAGFDFESGRSLLVRVLSDGRGVRQYDYDGPVLAVVAAEGAVWALVQGVDGPVVLRLDGRTGAVTRRTRLPKQTSLRSPIDGFAVGAGSLWATESESAVLHRVDLASGEAQSGDLGTFSTPPVVGYGWIWLCSWTTGGSMLRVDPKTLRSSLSRNALPAEDGRFAVGYGSLWRHDQPSGTIMRFTARTGDPAGIIPVLPAGAAGEKLTVTSIAAGAGGVWAAVAREY